MPFGMVRYLPLDFLKGMPIMVLGHAINPKVYIFLFISNTPKINHCVDVDLLYKEVIFLM